MSLFKLWDVKNYGKLKVKTLVENFIALGFAANEETALTFFRSMVTSPDGSILKPKEILESEITVPQYSLLFKSDGGYSNRILGAINREIKEA